MHVRARFIVLVIVENVAVVQKVIVDEKAGAFDAFLALIGVDKGLAVKGLKVLELINLKFTQREIGAEVKVATDESIEKVLRKLARVHDQIFTIMLHSRIDDVV